MTTIELGEVAPGSDLTAPEPPHGYDRRAARRLVVAAIAVLCLLG